MALMMVRSVLDVLRSPASAGTVASELLLLCGPLWAAVLVGLVVGWAWRPRWAAELVGAAGDAVRASEASTTGDGGGPASSAVGVGFPSLESLKSIPLPGCFATFGSVSKKARCSAAAGDEEEVGDGPAAGELRKEELGSGGQRLAVTTDDFRHLYRLVDETDGGPAWIPMMDRTQNTMTYQAWRRDPETGPPQYRSRTVFEDATPEMVRDFFWDDAYRRQLKWDDMLLHHETMEECTATGTMIVHWIRKFPFFCSDREYTIGRRIWNCEGAYYCVTKGVPYPSVPRKNKPRRVDLYYSSWCLRAVESRKGDGQMTACEITLFHHEDMGIPWEIAKLGIRQGMWGTVKKIEPGLRAYQKMRESDPNLSRCAYLAHINTKVTSDLGRQLDDKIETLEIDDVKKEKSDGKSISRYLLVGGAVALACSLDRGLLTKAVIFGVARRFAKAGR